MTTVDWIILVCMGACAAIAAGAFASLTKYLFDRGLADPKTTAPDVVEFYKTYIAHTRGKTGRIGQAFWVHAVAAGLFIAIGVGYTIVRIILPRIL